MPLGEGVHVMPRVRMHEHQVDVEPAAVLEAVVSLLPELRGAHVRPVDSGGTVVALFRVGETMVARFPLVPDAGDSRRAELLAEQAHARCVAAHIWLAVPQPVTVCEPVEAYPGWWSLWRWLPGETVRPDDVIDRDLLARDLATLVRQVHGIPTGGRRWDGTGRGGGHLAEKDAWVRNSIARSAHLVDAGAVTRVWEESLAARLFAGPAVTIHCDLMPANLLMRDGRLSGVIDWGAGYVGDPAADLTPAWHLLDRSTRPRWHAELASDEDAWHRGRGWALEEAIGALHYYENTNPHMFAAARRTLRELLAEA